MIQEGRPSKAKQDAYTLQTRAVENLNTAEIYQLSNAETNITFSQSDHPPADPRPSYAPLVLDAQIRGYDMDRVLNIIFTSTLR